MPVSPPRPASRVPTRTTRRTAIAAASALALAGCRWGPEDDVDAAPQPEVRKDADAEVVEQTLLVLRLRVAQLELTSERHVGLASALAPLVAAHTEHARLLSTGTGGEPVEADLPPESAAKALARVRREETALQRALTRAALEATSGDLARALASMSASTAQHVAALPTLKRGPA